MAKMYPADFPKSKLEEAKASCEDYVFNMLKKNLPDEAIIFYDHTLLGGRHADFIILWENLGCIVLESKAWNLETIEKTDDNNVYFKSNKHPESNPYTQARKYFYSIKNHLMNTAKYDTFIVDDYKGKKGLTFPVGTGVVLPRATKEEIRKASEIFKKPEETILTKDCLLDPEVLVKKMVALSKTQVYFNPTKGWSKKVEGYFNTMTVPENPQDLKKKILPKKKGESATERYNRIKENLQYVAKFFESRTVGSIQSEAFSNIYRDLEEDRFRVGVFAEVSRGKSTLINALLGEEIMRKGTGEATTKTLTMLSKPTKEKKHKSVVLEYRDLEEMELRIKRELHEIGINRDKIELESSSFRENLLNNISDGHDSNSDDVKKVCSYIKNVLGGWDNCSSYLGTEQVTDLESSDQLIHDEKIAVFIRRRTIYYDNKFLNLGIDLVDTPGLGSINERHDFETENFARNEADAALFITYPKELVSKNLKYFLKNKITIEDIQKKGFFLINQIGDLKPSELKQDYGDHNGLKDKLRSILDNELELILEHDRIETCDALCALHSKMIAEKQKTGPLTKEEQEIWDEYAMVDCKADIPSSIKNLEASRFSILEDSLENFLKKIKMFNTIYPKYKQLNEQSALFVESIEERKKQAKMEEKNLRAKLDKLKRAEKDIGDYLDRYFAKELDEKIEKDITNKAEQKIKKIINTIKEAISNSYKSKSENRIIDSVRKIRYSQASYGRLMLQEAIRDTTRSLGILLKEDIKYKEFTLSKNMEEKLKSSGDVLSDVMGKIFILAEKELSLDDLAQSAGTSLTLLKNLKNNLPEFIFNLKKVSYEKEEWRGTESPTSSVEIKKEKFTSLSDCLSKIEHLTDMFKFGEIADSLRYLFKKLEIDKRIKDLNNSIQEIYHEKRTNEMVEKINAIIKKQGEGEIKEQIVVGSIQEFKFSRRDFHELSKNAEKLKFGIFEEISSRLRSVFNEKGAKEYQKKLVEEKFDEHIKKDLIKSFMKKIKEKNEELKTSIKEKVEEEASCIKDNIHETLVRKGDKTRESKAYDNMIDQYHEDAKKAIELLKEIEQEVNSLASNPTTAIG